MKTILQALLAFSILSAGQTAFAQANGGANEIAKSYNSFGFNLLEKTREFFPGENVFLSPAGLAFALSMVADGAQGETRRQIKNVLQLTNGGADLDQANHALFEHLTTLDPKIKLEIANSVWTARDAEIKPPYLAALRQSYEAEVTNVDFKNPATAQKINAWCSDHTHGKIPQMVSPPLDAERLILLDAIYFKGDWSAPFAKDRTRNQPFTLADGKTVVRALMERRGQFTYFENDDFQAVDLPYAGGAVSMYVFLPKNSLSSFMKSLTLENWQRWTMQFGSRRGTLRMPRFKLENSYGLNKVLEALSMRDAFTRRPIFMAFRTSRCRSTGSSKKPTWMSMNKAPWRPRSLA